MGGDMSGRLDYGSFVFLTLFIAAPIHAAPFDYQPYESILHRFAKPGVVIDGIGVTAVDYTALAAEAGQSSSNYRTLLNELRSFNPETLESREDKMAFWINVYNIAAMKTIVDHYPVDSIRSKKIHWLGLPWDRKIITVEGKEYSLGQIENDILLDTFKDLRIHFGINCASVSCVNLALEPYRGETLIKQLNEQGKQFMADPQKGLRIDRQKKVIYLSQVFKFDKKHFDQLGGGALNSILPYLSPEDREFIRKEKENLTVEYLDYDWKANDIKNAR
jgi:hypothetical protein